MTRRGFFVTGTDTECGKTEISLACMQLLQQRGLSVLGMKPVAAGAELTPLGLRNEDALRLQAQGSFDADYSVINAYAFAPPVAPHIAAAQAGICIEPEPILSGLRMLMAQADWVVVEGIGGWKVPLGLDWDMAQLAKLLELPVILVVGLKLGCLNHALLSAESIRAQGLTLTGWVGNAIDPRMQEREANIGALRALLDCPCLGVVPRLRSISTARVGAHLDPKLLLIDPD